MPTEMVQLFYAGAGGVTTRWRNPIGTWSTEQDLGGTPPIGPVTAITVPGTGVLHVFYLDVTNGVYWRCRNADGSWSDEQRLAGTALGAITAAADPGNDVLQLFYVGPGRGVTTRWRKPNGSWSAEQDLGGQVSGNEIAALTIPDLRLFYRGGDGEVSSRLRHPDGSWSPELNLGGAVHPDGNVAACVIPDTPLVQLFYRSTDNTVRCICRNPDGSWSSEQNLGGAALGDITATSIPGEPETPEREVIQLFYVGTDHAVWSRRRNPDDSWLPEQRIGGRVIGDDGISTTVVPHTPGSAAADNDVVQLFYAGTNGVSTLWPEPDGSWSAEQQLGGDLGGDTAGDITVALVPFAIGSALFVSVYENQPHFTYRDANAELQDAWREGANWHLQRLSRLSDDGPAGPGPAPNSLFVSIYDDRQHFTYVDVNGDLQDIWREHGSWRVRQINIADGLDATPPPAAGGLFVSAHHNEHHFAYLDAHGGIQDIWFDGTTWHLQHINAIAGGPPAVDDLFISVYNNQQHFTYRDRNAQLHDAWYDGASWQLQRINTADGLDAAPAAGSLFVSAHHNEHHFAYLDAHGGIQDIWFDGTTWHLQQINAIAGGPPAVDDLFISVYNNQQHFTYRDHNAQLHDAWYDGASWQLQQINTAHGLDTAPPPAVGSLFVSAHDNEHHFAYLDAHGGIQDIWFDGTNWHLQQINAGAGVTVSGEYPATGGPAAARPAQHRGSAT